MAEDLEQEVARYYADSDVLNRLLPGLEAAGIDLNTVTHQDLATVDELHIGGRVATTFAVEAMALRPSDHVLDVGCGIGGAARYMAAQIGCAVTGIDLTTDFIETARMLGDITGFSDKISYHVASALDMPFGDDSFDAAVTFHVAMNIKDRKGLYQEVARVLKPGAKFCIYDVMAGNGEDLAFPVPWAATAQTSHLETSDDMRVLLARAGFEVDEVIDRTDFALAFFHQREAAAKEGRSPPGLAAVLNITTSERVANLIANIKSGKVAPTLILARKKPA